jgi:Glycosyl hydrolase-like 10
MLTRREFLRAQIMGITLIVVEPRYLLGSPAEGAGHASLPWTRYVRIAGNPLSLDRVEQIVKEATQTHVFGIETDNDIQGHYESFRDPHPAEKLAALKAMADAAHVVGNYAFVYVTGFECITSHAEQAKHTLYKDHPEWMQRKITGEPALFGGGTAFWISAGDEDVWVSPYAPEWRKLYMEHVRQIAATGIDGIYVDVAFWMTHFPGWRTSWPSFDKYTVAEFKSRTGLDAMKDLKLGDFSDANFRRWVDFRTTSITEFMKEVRNNMKSVNPKSVTIAEVYPGIEFLAMQFGSDVYQLYDVIDVIAHEYCWINPTMNRIERAMNAADKAPLDWLHWMIGMYSFRSFAGEKASWMLSYSWDREKDVSPSENMQNLFASQLAAGTNCWDARGHVMSGSNDIAMRTEIFAWIAMHERLFYNSRTSIHPIGIYFSPHTRDYFCEEFLDSYLGLMALVMHGHREFEIVTPRTLAAFHGEILALPDARCLGAQEVSELEKYARSGGKLIVTGQSGQYDETGKRVELNRLHQLLGVRNPAEKSMGTAGLKYAYLPDRPGKAYWQALSKDYNGAGARGVATQSSASLLHDFDTSVIQPLGFDAPVQVEASPFVTAQIARVDGKIHIFLFNFTGLVALKITKQIPARKVAVSFPATAGSRVFLLHYLGTVSELSAESKGERIHAVIPEVEKGATVWIE